MSWANGYRIVLSNLLPALRGFMRLCFYSNVYCFVHCSQLLYVQTVNTITLCYVIVCCTWLANCSHETPLSGARLLKGLATELCGPSDRHLEALPLVARYPRAHYTAKSHFDTNVNRNSESNFVAQKMTKCWWGKSNENKSTYS